MKKALRRFKELKSKWIVEGGEVGEYLGEDLMSCLRLALLSVVETRAVQSLTGLADQYANFQFQQFENSISY